MQSINNVFPILSNDSSIILSKELDGSSGKNRCQLDKCQIKAVNDYQAIHCWLNEYRHKETTYRAYKKEAERLLLWSIINCHKPFSSLTRDDLEQYFAFLNNPTPVDFWCAPKGGKKYSRNSAQWRPFVGPLSKSAKSTAITILNSLMSYLTQANYLSFNQMSLIRKKMTNHSSLQSRSAMVTERILQDDEWKAILLTLENMPSNNSVEIDEKERLKFIIYILFFLGLRISELETHKWSNFKKINDRWWFFVKGKGDKLAKIPVADELLNAINHFRVYQKLAPFPLIDEDRFLIPSFRSNKSISSRQISYLLKNLAVKASELFEDDEAKKNKLKKFSPHWLRHLSASMQDRMGIALKHIKANHRHENDTTTRLYIHANDNERHQEINKLRLSLKNEKL